MFIIIVGLVFLSVASSGVGALTPWLLVLRGDVANASIQMLVIGVVFGGTLGIARAWWRLRQHRFLLRALTLGSRSTEPYELEELLAEDWRITTGWLVPTAAALILSCTVWRPIIVDLRTSVSVALLGTIVVAAGASSGLTSSVL